jgi:hypothetical protein
LQQPHYVNIPVVLESTINAIRDSFSSQSSHSYRSSCYGTLVAKLQPQLVQVLLVVHNSYTSRKRNPAAFLTVTEYVAAAISKYSSVLV